LSAGSAVDSGIFSLPLQFTESYDVVVVGAGHAGCEAAMAPLAWD
jgi:NADPH-dependent 2,4-dienoyl-CoA reductase/sulfur reductase-like enzyme